ncbi:MAG: FecR domain-containing protein [Verrucomicrobiota bacterium]
MKKTKLLLILFALSLHNLWADPVMLITALGDIKFVDPQGKTLKEINLGTIGEDIEVADQTLRISHGRDLQGHLTTMIYQSPDGEAPTNISLWLFGKKIDLKDGAVLTIRSSKDTSATSFKTGVLGSVTVDGKALDPSSEFNFSYGEKTPQEPELTLAEQEELILPTTEVKNSDPDVETPQADLSMDVPEILDPVIKASVLQIIGKVESIDTETSSTRALIKGDSLTQGMILRTDASGTAILQLIQGSGTWLEPNTEVEIQTLSNSEGKSAVILVVHKGHIVSALEDVDHSLTSYKIKTHHGIVEAKGTLFSIINKDEKITSQVADGMVQLYNEDGTYNFSLESGFGVTLDGNDLTPESLSVAERKRISQVRNIIREQLGLAPTETKLAALSPLQ